MKRFFQTLALSAALTAPAVSMADTLRSISPARQMLQQLTLDMPAHREASARSQIAGHWTPHSVYTPRFGMLRLPVRGDNRFTIERDGDLRFTLGCNQYWAQTRHWHNRIEIGPIAGTRMACPGRRDAAERRVLRALSDAERVETRHGTLRFMDRWGRPLLVLDAPARNGWRFGR